MSEQATHMCAHTLLRPCVHIPQPAIPTITWRSAPMHAPGSVAFPVLAFVGPPAAGGPAASRSLCAFLSDRMISSCSAGLLARNSGFFLARLRYRWLTLPIDTMQVRLLRGAGRADATTATQGRRVGPEVR